jgi:hypothetical protein
MLYVTSPDDATAAAAAGIDILSIEAKDFTTQMREAAGTCFVQVGLTSPTKSTVDGKLLITTEHFLEAAYRYTAIGGDCFYCAASFEIQKSDVRKSCPDCRTCRPRFILHHLDQLTRSGQECPRGTEDVETT